MYEIHSIIEFGRCEGSGRKELGWMGKWVRRDRSWMDAN